MNELSRIVGVDPATLEKHMNEFGISIISERPDMPGGLAAKLNDKEWLYEQHHTQNRSVRDIAEELGISHSRVLPRMIEFGIERMNAPVKVSDANTALLNDSDWIFERYINRDMAYVEIAEELGLVGISAVINSVKNAGIRPRLSGTKMPKLAREILVDKQKMEEAYASSLTIGKLAEVIGTSHPIAKRYLEEHGIPIKRTSLTSRGEKELAEFIKTLGLNVVSNTRNVIFPKELDMWLPDTRTAIEFNGVYWHSDSQKSKFYHSDKLKE